MLACAHCFTHTYIISCGKPPLSTHTHTHTSGNIRLVLVHFYPYPTRITPVISSLNLLHIIFQYISMECVHMKTTKKVGERVINSWQVHFAEIIVHVFCVHSCVCAIWWLLRWELYTLLHPGYEHWHYTSFLPLRRLGLTVHSVQGHRESMGQCPNQELGTERWLLLERRRWVGARGCHGGRLWKVMDHNSGGS